jgi:hypothetical protein
VKIGCTVTFLIVVACSGAQAQGVCAIDENFQERISRIQALTMCDMYAPFDSEWIIFAKYCSSAQDGFLILKIKNRKERDYLFGGVPLNVWRQFTIAESPGRFFNKEIKFRYHCSRSSD